MSSLGGFFASVVGIFLVQVHVEVRRDRARMESERADHRRLVDRVASGDYLRTQPVEPTPVREVRPKD